MSAVFESLDEIVEPLEAAKRIKFPWYEKERERSNAAPAQTSLFGGDAMPVTRFHSGSTAFWDAKGFMLAGVPVGITATAMPKKHAERLLKELGDYTRKGGLVFVDSGAFGAFVARQRLDFAAEVFPVYDALMQACDPRGLRLVMPDVVGNPEASMALQKQHAQRIRGWMKQGAQCIFPLHSPSDERFLKAIESLVEGMPWTVGVPSNLEAWSFPELQGFCERHQPGRIHLLGMGQPSRVRVVAEGVAQVSPGTEVGCDSCTLLAHVGYGRRLTDRCNTRLKDAVQWVMDDPTAEVPYPDLSTYVANVLYEVDYLKGEDIERLAARFGLNASALMVASKTEGLIAELGKIDPDETWFERELALFARDELLKPKLEALLRGPIRAWEVARLAGMPDEELGEA